MIKYDVFDAIEDNDLKALKGFASSIESGGSAWSPLHKAAKLGRTELLGFILKQQSSVAINDSFEIGEPDDFRSGTALTEALLNGHVDAAIFLIEQGANVNETYYGYEDTHCFGLEIEESGTCLTLAIAIGNDELLQLMNQHGLDINAEFNCNHKEMTAFAYYLECADIEALQKLFDLGADITALVKDEWNNDVTPLMQAIRLYNPYHKMQRDSTREKRLAVIEWLLRHGVDLGYVHEESELPTVLSVVMDANDHELNQLFGLIACQAKKTIYSELALEMAEELAPAINTKIQASVRSHYKSSPAFDMVSEDCTNEWQEMGAMLFDGSHLLLDTGINQLEYSVSNTIKKLSRAERLALWCKYGDSIDDVIEEFVCYQEPGNSFDLTNDRDNLDRIVTMIAQDLQDEMTADWEKQLSEMENDETDDEDETNLFGTEIQTAASMMNDENKSQPQPNPIVEARGDGLKSAFEIELNGLMLEPDALVYLDKLERIAVRVEAAGLSQALDAKLNEAADLLAEAEKAG